MATAFSPGFDICRWRTNKHHQRIRYNCRYSVWHKLSLQLFAYISTISDLYTSTFLSTYRQRIFKVQVVKKSTCMAKFAKSVQNEWWTKRTRFSPPTLHFPCILSSIEEAFVICNQYLTRAILAQFSRFQQRTTMDKSFVYKIASIVFTKVDSEIYYRNRKFSRKFP